MSASPGPIRDLAGYGASPPAAPWPDGKRIAVNFCINYEEGAERTILNGDDGSEDRLTEAAVERRIGGRDLNAESYYGFGARVGYWRLLSAFADRGLSATVNLVGLAGELVPDPLAAMLAAGFDIQSHGWRWIDYRSLSEAEERAHMQMCIDQAIDLTGTAPQGYYAGMPSENTQRLCAEMGFAYNSDAYDDERPYWWTGGAQPLLILPYSVDTNDARAFSPGKSQSGERFFTYLKDTFDVLRTEGDTMLTIGLHARIIARPGRVGGLYRLLDHIAAHEDAWICKRSEIAEAWATAYPAK